ncbi:polygalacturonase-like [Telopea speciosissima]|uniref:polygalacturonase-like n=1 Tax=Telopea speciosissima TaxID=54955 RepID=UPI001CC55708|nr:polygalacturonase-like [Telopea speciosissima]
MVRALITMITTSLLLLHAFFIPFLLLSSSLINASSTINIIDHGAIGDGKKDDSQAFVAAWNIACKSSEPTTTIYVPSQKRFLISPISFQGPCNNSKITFQMEGTLVAPDYKKMSTSTNYWLMFNGVQGVSIIGGYLDGQGTSLWACKASGTNCPTGAVSLAFYSSKDILIQNLRSMNAKLFHILVHSSQDTVIQGVRIDAPGNSPNTDGIHVQNSVNVRVFNVGIRTGDDCISIGPGTRYLLIQNVTCGPGHGISIGSLGKASKEKGVQNVVVKNVVFSGTQNGLRIKTWARPSDGFVTGVVFKQIVMKNVQNPIIIDQNYCPHKTSCPNQNSGIQISGVTYTNIVGTSATQVAMKFDCSKTTPCKQISLESIKLTYKDQTAKSFCKNVHGTADGVASPHSCV